MQATALIVAIMACTFGLVVVNVVFRYRVLRAYRQLRAHRVDFDGRLLLNRRRLEEEVVPRYPHLRRQILEFHRNLRLSVLLGSALVLLILLFGFVLLRWG